MAFVSSSNNNSTNGAVNTAKVVNTANGVSTADTQVNTANIDNLSDTVICVFLASQPSSSQLINEDLKQIHPDDLKEMDLKWQMAMESTRRNVPIETINSSALVSCDGLREEFTSEPAVETFNAKTSEDVPKNFKKDNGASIIEDSKLDDEDESVPQPKIEKTVKPSVAKRVNTVRNKNVNTARSKAVVNTARPKAVLKAVNDYKEIDGGYVAFGGNPKGGKITGKDTIRTGKLDFENVYFVKELKSNLFSVSQIVPRKNNMYSVDLKNIIPKEV
nr:putative ribonuclease H-like domain-containing protein [Tanacetum cinerariifolium]